MGFPPCSHSFEEFCSYPHHGNEIYGGDLALKLLIVLILRTNIEPSSYVVTNTIIVTPGTMVSVC